MKSELVTLDDMIAAADYSRRQARNQFAKQIHRFLAGLATTESTTRELELLTAVGIYVEQEAAAE